MAKFSDRMGFTQAPKEIQIESMNDDLRNSLWNWVVDIYKTDSGLKSLPKIWRDYLKRPIDSFISGTEKAGWLKTHFMSSEWYEPYNIIEFTFRSIVPGLIVYSNRVPPEVYAERLNQILERELSGYRFIEGEFAPITDKEEVESIRQAMSEP